MSLRPFLIVLALCAGLVATAEAARVFPQNSFQAKITQVADDAIVANGKTLHLAPGVLISTPSNATLVKGALPRDVVARIQLDLNGDVRHIWLLADDEIRPVKHWWEFWKTEDVQ